MAVTNEGITFKMIKQGRQEGDTDAAGLKAVYALQALKKNDIWTQWWIMASWESTSKKKSWLSEE